MEEENDISNGVGMASMAKPWMRKKMDERGNLGEGGVERNRAPRARKSKQRQYGLGVSLPFHDLGSLGIFPKTGLKIK